MGNVGYDWQIHAGGVGYSSTVLIENSSFIENWGNIGAAVFISRGKLTIEGSFITRSRLDYGAIYIQYDAQVDLSDTTISENELGVRLLDTTKGVTRTRVRFVYNRRGLEMDDSANIQIVDSLVHGNVFTEDSYLHSGNGGGVSIAGCTAITINSTVFRSNKAAEGS